MESQYLFPSMITMGLSCLINGDVKAVDLGYTYFSSQAPTRQQRMKKIFRALPIIGA
jgi:hypothetical protein